MNVNNGGRLSGLGPKRVPSSESMNSLYLSCSSIAGDGPHSPSTEYKSFSLDSNSPTWQKSLLGLEDVVTTQDKKWSIEAPPKFYVVDPVGSTISLIYAGPGDQLVTIQRNLPPDDCEGVLRRPIYMFKSAVNWKHAARIILADLDKDGVYFVGICWKIKRSYQLANGAPFLSKDPYILHCVCKEPKKRFQGRVGPISIFVPNHEVEGKRIGGVWVSLFADENRTEFIDQLMPFQEQYRRQLKAVNEKMDQLMFFVSNDAACVGIQVMNTKSEEKIIKKSKRVYHHERPLILEDGFYLVEGQFAASFLNCNASKNTQLQLDCSPTSPKIVIIGEGTHLIRTTTEPLQNGSVAKRRMNRRERPKRISSVGSSPGLSSTTTLSEVSDLSEGSKTENNDNLRPIDDTDISEQKDDSRRELAGKVSKIRKVEVCLDCRYERIIALDHSVLQHDFMFKVDSSEQ